MENFVKRVLFNLYMGFHSVMMYISQALAERKHIYEIGDIH